MSSSMPPWNMKIKCCKVKYRYVMFIQWSIRLLFVNLAGFERPSGWKFWLATQKTQSQSYKTFEIDVKRNSMEKYHWIFLSKPLQHSCRKYWTSSRIFSFAQYCSNPQSFINIHRKKREFHFWHWFMCGAGNACTTVPR